MKGLEKEESAYYVVRRGQTIYEIARYFCVAERLLVKENDLKAEPSAGQILKIPKEKGDAYYVTETDDKSLLCGSEENYARKNGTDIIYVGMRVIL